MSALAILCPLIVWRRRSRQKRTIFGELTCGGKRNAEKGPFDAFAARLQRAEIALSTGKYSTTH